MALTWGNFTWGITTWSGMFVRSTLVTDRAQNDITAKTEKAYYNAADLNRVELWTQYLAGLLHSYGYTVPVTVKTNWTVYDVPFLEDINRIRTNVDALQTGFYSLPDWREIVYNNTLDFNQANALEWDLNAIETWLNRMLAALLPRQANTQFMIAGGIFNV